MRANLRRRLLRLGQHGYDHPRMNNAALSSRLPGVLRGRDSRSSRDWTRGERRRPRRISTRKHERYGRCRAPSSLRSSRKSSTAADGPRGTRSCSSSPVPAGEPRRHSRVPSRPFCTSNMPRDDVTTEHWRDDECARDCGERKGCRQRADVAPVRSAHVTVSGPRAWNERSGLCTRSSRNLGAERRCRSRPSSWRVIPRPWLATPHWASSSLFTVITTSITPPFRSIASCHSSRAPPGIRGAGPSVGRISRSVPALEPSDAASNRRERLLVRLQPGDAHTDRHTARKRCLPTRSRLLRCALGRRLPHRAVVGGRASPHSVRASG